MKAASEAPTALLLVDVQKAFGHPTHWGSERNNPELEDNVAALVQAFRRFTSANPAHPARVIHVHHHSAQAQSMLHPSAELEVGGTVVRGVEAQACAAPDADGNEPIFTKSVNSSFIGTGLEAYLREHGIRQLVVAGLTTDHCVSTTVRMAANLKVLGPHRGGVDGSGPGGDDHGILLVSDATATFAKGSFDADTLHRAHLASLDGEFCAVVKTSQVLGNVLLVR